MKPVKVRLLLVGLVTALMIAPSALASVASAQVVDQIPAPMPRAGGVISTHTLSSYRFPSPNCKLAR
jgi:hypothetical protein